MISFIRTSKSWRIITPLLAFLLVLAVACGSASAPDTTAPDTTAPDTTAPEVAAAPTAVPEAMAEPAEAMAEVNPGKLTWMLASFGNERFEYLVSRGTGHDMARILHGFLISSDLEDGKRVFSPGIATSWEISADGLSWTLNLRDDVKF